MDLVIENYVPVPPVFYATGMGQLREALKWMLPGQSFLWNNSSKPLQVAREIGVWITTRRMEDGRVRVWKIGTEADRKRNHSESRQANRSRHDMQSVRNNREHPNHEVTSGSRHGTDAVPRLLRSFTKTN